ncbi:MAG: 23S rRNA (pseudouridine(1915)-N(3))-methyltransferase RlmH [Mucilaginibacter polytrichastri]|nr:23S rRNA (pseudouridine(1915)-N(3))-methyltransferase RlmH [Mucilaginibacter polytrichastri]
MKITLITVGKTDERFLQEGIDKYLGRLKHYVRFSLVEIPDIRNSKNLSEDQQKAFEGEKILKLVSPGDHLVLLDEKGREMSSESFATYLNKKMLASVSHLIFVVGGPYGFSPEVRNRANELLSLSQMTFSHQMIRLFFTEQVYRAFTILKGEPYHHA